MVCCAHPLSESTPSVVRVRVPYSPQWQDGRVVKAAVCKTVFMGSIPILASIMEVLSNWLARLTVNQVRFYGILVRVQSLPQFFLEGQADR